jgi:ATP-dependent Clp protease protease subunit
MANIVVAQLLFLESQDPDKDINLYINSPGGSVTAGMSIYDTMQFIKPDVATICVGMAASMASVLLMGGAKGKRFALSHSEVMIHQPMGWTGGQASDVEIRARHLLRTRDEIYKLIMLHTGQPRERIVADTDRDTYLTAAEALDYGIIDQVVNKRTQA